MVVSFSIVILLFFGINLICSTGFLSPSIFDLRTYFLSKSFAIIVANVLGLPIPSFSNAFTIDASLKRCGGDAQIFLENIKSHPSV